MQKNFVFLFFRKGSIIKSSFKLNLFVFLMLIAINSVWAKSYSRPSLSTSDTSPNATELQQVTVKGTVTDQQGAPMAGVTIVVKGTAIGTLTDVNGKYSLTNVPKDGTLIFSFIGMTPQQVPLSGKINIDIVMKEEAVSLEEIVVIGFGSQKKETVTGAIASIKTQNLLQSPQANISNALAGRLPGLLSVQPQGVPGNDQAIIQIRGQGTFSGNTSPLILVDGIESLNYNNIDPNEIESVAILKDASSTAVYGVRGANGVLIITTKRGKVGKPQVGFTSSYAVSRFTQMKRFSGSYDYANAFNEALKYESFLTGIYTPKYDAVAIEHYRVNDDPIFYPNTNWTDLMLKPLASQYQTNLNISGGTEKVKYFVSAAYFSQEGLFNNTNLAPGFNAQISFGRTNFRSNLDFDVTKRLTLKVDLSSQIEQRKAPGAPVQYTMERIFRAPPTCSPGIVDGKVVNVIDVFGGNPLEQLLGTGTSNTYTNYLNGSVKVNYLLDFITKGLSFRGTVSYKNRMLETKTYTRQLLTYRPKRLLEGSIVYAPQASDQAFGFSSSSDKDRTVYLEYGFDYSRSFGSQNITALFLYNQSKYYSPSLAYLVPNGYQGLVGRVTYDYAKRYLAEFDIGYNGTENFAPGKRFGIFPAYSLGWIVSEEGFFPKNDIVSFLKLRGSYGEVGNDKIGGNRFVYQPSSYSYSGSAYWGMIGSTFQAYPASVEGILGNPDLTWERAKKTDIGVDATFLKGKIKLTADWFNENRNNILAVPGNLPITVGATFPALNMGKMKNSGYETDLTYNNKIGNFEFFINANFTYAHNVVKFQDEVKRPFSYQYRTGQRLGQFYGFVAEGYYNTWEEVNDANRAKTSYQSNKLQPGDIIFKDVNGDGIISPDDMVPIGYSTFPEKIFGVSFGGNYKGFDLSILFQGANNVSVRYSKMTIRGFQEDRSVVDYIPGLSWTQERYEQGLPIEFPHLAIGDYNSHNYQSSSWGIVDGSYLRLKNAEIGYTLSSAKLKKLNVGSVRFYLNGYNMFTWSKMLKGVDPEISSPGDADYEPYPINTTFNIGINIKF